MTHRRILTALLLVLPASLFARNGVYSLKLFYAWWMLLSGVIFSLTFHLLWRMKHAEGSPNEKIEGIKWFSRALAVWGLSGLANIFILQQPASSLAPTIGEILSRSIFSSLNSVFILFAIPSIEINGGAQGLIKDIITWTRNKKVVVLFSGIFFIMTVFIFCLFRFQFALTGDDAAWYWLYLPDVVFSVFTILALLTVFLAAFRERQRHMSGMVSIVYLTICFTFLAELSLLAPIWLNDYIAEYAIFYNLVSTVFKMLLIVLFAILLYSWEMKKAEEQKVADLLSFETCKEKFELEQIEVIVLRRLATGRTREDIGSDPELFRSPLRSRKNVDEILEKKIAPKLKLPNKEPMILLFALQNKIIPYTRPAAENAAESPEE